MRVYPRLRPPVSDGRLRECSDRARLRDAVEQRLRRTAVAALQLLLRPRGDRQSAARALLAALLARCFLVVQGAEGDGDAQPA